MMKLNIQLFASGSFEFPNWTSGSGIRGKIEWSSTIVGDTASEKSSNNKSRVTANIYVMRSGSSSNPTYGRMWHGYVNINGNNHSYSETYNGGIIYVSNSWVLVNSFTDIVPHNSDGTKSCYIAGEVYGPDGTSLGSKRSWGDSTVTLDTIDRMSEITSVTSGTTNYAPVLKWTPLNSEFTYKIEYSYGNWSSGQSSLISPASTSEQTYNSYTITGSSVAPYITDRETATFTATLYTYASDGTTLIGSTTKTFNVTLNASYVPTASIGAITDTGGLVPAGWGILVQGKSKLSYTVTGTPSTGSTISGYSSTVEGVTYNTSNVETGFIAQSGSISAYVTDSRGRPSSTVTSNYTVYPYATPVITVATAERCLQDGTLSDQGTYIKYSFSANVSSCDGNNTPTYQLGYRVHNTGSYTYITINNGATNVIIPNVTFNASTSYDIQFLASDYFTSTPVTITLLVHEGFRLVHYNKSKKALAIGKTSTATGDTKLLEIGTMPIDINIPAEIKGDGETFLRYNASKSVVLSSNGSDLYLRPNGTSNSAGQFYVTKDGATIQTYGSKSVTSYYDSNYYWNFNTDASEVKFNKQIYSDGGFYTSGALTTTGNDTGVVCDNQAVGRKTKFTVSGGGNAGIYDNTNSNWIIKSNTNQTVEIPHPLSVNGYDITPYILYDNKTGVQAGNYITINNLSTYKKLQITFSLYDASESNQGGSSNICWLDLTRTVGNTCRSGIVVPYLADSITGTSMGSDFRAVFEANLSNNRLYCFFAYGTGRQVSGMYIMTKVVGYKY